MYENIRIIMISGKQGSGKTTLQKALDHFFTNTEGAVVQQFNFADPLRKMHDDLRAYLQKYGLRPPPDVSVKDGKLMQFLGTDWVRSTYGPNAWITILERRLKIFNSTSQKRMGYAIIGDCRFQNEFDAFPEALRVRLEAPALVRKSRAENWRTDLNHPSETDLDGYAEEGRFDVQVDTAACGPVDVFRKVLAASEVKWGMKKK